MSDYCDVAWGDCVNPTGYGGRDDCAANPNPPKTRVTCFHCGVTACRACRKKVGPDWVCKECPDEEDPT